MDVQIPDSLPMQPVAVDKSECLVVICHNDCRELVKQAENQRAIGQASARDFADYEWVHEHGTAVEQRSKLRVDPAQMVDPVRRIDQYQEVDPERRRGGDLKLRWLPPSRARRLALSRSIRAFKPSRTVADRSSDPVSLTAFASNSSSIFIVVRIACLSVSIKCSAK